MNTEKPKKTKFDILEENRLCSNPLGENLQRAERAINSASRGRI